MKKWLVSIIKLLISSIILYYILEITPSSEIAKSLRSANLTYIMIGILLCLLNVYIAAAQMKIITDNQRMSLSVHQIAFIGFITRFYGLFLPGYMAGGVIRWYRLSQPDRKAIEALSSMVLNRILITIIVAGSAVLFLILDSSTYSNSQALLCLTGVFSAFVFSYLMLIIRKPTLLFKNYIIEKTPLIIPVSLQHKIEALLNSASKFQTLQLRSHIRLVGLSIIWRLLGILAYYTFACAIGIHISFISIGWISSVTLLLVMIPISFSGLGVREGTLIYLLGLYGVSPNYAVALSLVVFAQNVLTASIGGLCEANIVLSGWFPKNPTTSN